MTALGALSGVLVAGAHKAFVYSGKLLGINGVSTEESTAVLLDAIVKSTNGQFPTSIVFILAAVVGAFVVAQITSWVPEDLRRQIIGGGTVQSLTAVASGKPIPLQAALLRVVVTAIYLGSGGTLGGEGPAIQVCTAFATMFGWLIGLRNTPTISLLATLGFSAGFAASFNAPLAGILFAIEELEHVCPRLSPSIMSVIIIASASATAVNRAIAGNLVLFQMSRPLTLLDDVNKVFGQSVWHLIAVPIGVLTAVACWLIIRLLRLGSKMLRWKWLEKAPFTLVFVAHAFFAASVGAIVYESTGLKGVWGIGAESLQQIFNHDYPIWVYIVFAVGKLLAMVAAINMRCPGDMLEPILISGGFLGGAVGRLLNLREPLLLNNGNTVAPCVLFGMVGLFSSCFRFPLTPIVFVFELTGVESYELILPSAVASFTAMAVASRLCPTILDEILHQDGVNLHDLAEQAEEEFEEELERASCKEDDGTKSQSSLGNSPPDSRARISAMVENALLGGTTPNIRTPDSRLYSRRPSIISNASGRSCSGGRLHLPEGGLPMRPSYISDEGVLQSLGRHRRPSAVSNDSYGRSPGQRLHYESGRFSQLARPPSAEGSPTSRISPTEVSSGAFGRERTTSDGSVSEKMEWAGERRDRAFSGSSVGDVPEFIPQPVIERRDRAYSTNSLGSLDSVPEEQFYQEDQEDDKQQDEQTPGGGPVSNLEPAGTTPPIDIEVLKMTL